MYIPYGNIPRVTSTTSSYSAADARYSTMSRVSFCEYHRPFVFRYLRIAFPANPLFSKGSALPRGGHKTLPSSEFRLRFSPFPCVFIYFQTLWLKSKSQLLCYQKNPDSFRKTPGWGGLKWHRHFCLCSDEDGSRRTTILVGPLIQQWRGRIATYRRADVHAGNIFFSP